MSMTDPLGDMLSRIRNAQMRGKSKVVAPASRMRADVLEVLKEEGYIRGYTRVEYAGGKTDLEIELKYHEGQPGIQRIERISTPGRRIYSSVRELPLVDNGLGISILSTPKGIMSDAAARANNVGGELLCQVF